MAELLVSHGININEKDKDGKTTLDINQEYYRSDLADFLVSHGATISQSDM
ncbi:hypothetical protein TVAG_002170 [Trichomonas vaginalis G3]|uniref:Uncharacterized protein n=1 Tax=Trichomonas vaginalis (strain ATCC PRA-98 / G3) TaxID=412133 RepID=A2FVV9_TRIV3|nr:Ankyrin repeat family [Trichomonas vaginalis G3]EAX90944.1 hypothetical protein TVAG_002170 [Trichomonas vaginalis G3]KAI5548648.1 Ankyrin repeat family [Trichomonas vaginalis G3]|eukprot:XP_001303874.1 hypothetical protein [Trichomonas vaginalis G3]